VQSSQRDTGVINEGEASPQARRNYFFAWHGATDEVSRGGGDLSRLLLKQAIARLSGTTDAHRAHRIDLKSSLMLRTEVKAGIGN
jgi:hypothetical protein